MGISGSQPALMYALGGVARGGATRGGYHSPKVFVAINGTQYGTGRLDDDEKVLYDSLSISEALNDTPNTASFTMKGFEPDEGADVVLTLGSINNLTRLFAGTVISRTHGYTGTPENWKAPLNAIDYTWQLNRRLVSGSWTATSATVIAKAVVAELPWISDDGIVEDLPVLDTFSYTNQSIIGVLTQLAKRIGGYCDVDYHLRAKLFITDDSITNPLDLTSANVSLTDFSYTRDLSQTRTRWIGEGGGSNATKDALPGDTSLRIEDDSWYNPLGGSVRSGPQTITYTGITGGYIPPIVDQIVRTTPTAMTSVVWADSLHLFVAISASGCATSPDGITWTTQTIPASGGTYADLVWAPEIPLLVALGSSGAIATSPDGITWTARTSPGGASYNSVAWSPELQLFVAVGANLAASSPDGITWTARTPASASTWVDVIWADTFFVACHQSGGTAAAMTTTDGITWTLQTTAASSILSRLAWSPELQLLVGVGGFAATPAGYVQTSPDGVTWTSRTAGNNNTWRPVAWIRELGVFAAASNDGSSVTGRRMMTSPDGITWTTYATPTAGAWTALTWAAELGVMLVVTSTTVAMTNSIKQYRALTGIPASGAGAIQYAINTGDPVNLRVQVDDLAAQAALALLLDPTATRGDDGIIEDIFSDGRISETEALARATAQLALTSTARVGIAYPVRDKNTHPGTIVHVDLGSPTSVLADFLIQRVTIAKFQPALMPTYTVTATNDRFSLEDLLRLARLQRSA